MEKHVVIICTAISFDDKKNIYIKKTGMSGKGYSFDFITVSNSDYYLALKKLEEIHKKDPLSHIYVIHGHKSGKNFTKRIKRTLNNRFKKFLDDIFDSEKILIDLRSKSTANLFGKDVSDKKRQKYVQLKKTG